MTKLRTDAARNRADILMAADEVFAMEGVTAPLDLVCRKAGVGRATLYRNFPDRHALMIALLGRALDETEEKARSLGDGDGVLFELLRFHAERINARSALVDYWRVVDVEAPEMKAARDRFNDTWRPLLERAVASKLCRPDLTVEDVSLLTNMLGAALRGRSVQEQEALGMRAMAFVLEGLLPRGGDRP